MNAARPAALVAIAAFAAFMLPGEQAESSVDARHQLGTAPRGWSAVIGSDVSALLARGHEFDAGTAAAADAPYCDADAAIARTLSHDFGEALVDDARIGGAVTQLWGSDLMGTWTLVMARPDNTSCVVASGIGFSSGENPGVYYTKAGLPA